MARFLFPLVSLVLMAPVCAQGVIGTAVERLPGFLRAEHFNVAPPDLRPIPANTNLAPSYSLSAISGNARADLSCTVTQGLLPEFRVQVRAFASVFGTAGDATVSSDADIVLGLVASQPTYGVLTVETYTPPSNGAPGCGSYTVDVCDDGSVEVRAFCTIAPRSYREFALTLPVGETRIHVVHRGNLGTSPAGISDYTADLTVRWIPLTGVLTEYQPPCNPLAFTLSGQHSDDGGFVLSGPGSRQNVWLLFGTLQQAVPLQLPPNCVLATDIATFLPWSEPMQFPWTPLPRGFALNVQAVWFDSPTRTLTSNALRLAVP